MKQPVDQRYLEMSIATSSKETLIVKIFDVLLLAAQTGYDKLLNDRGDVEGIHKALLRAQKALAILMGALDMEIGGDLAKNLFRVYEFWHHELVMANMEKNPERVERLLPNFRSYRETWAQAVAEYQTQRREIEIEARSHDPRLYDADSHGSSFVAVG